MLNAQEEERQRVACEVLDGLAQTAVAAHGLLEAFAENHPSDSEEIRRELGPVLELVQRVVEESRGVIGRLRPPALDDLVLTSALRLQVEALREESWEIVYEDALGDVRLPLEAGKAHFRVGPCCA